MGITAAVAAAAAISITAIGVRTSDGRSDLAVVVGPAWLTLALPPAVATTWMQLGWWIGHFLEILGARICALMLKLGEKGDYTEGHTRRVALRAVQVGEELDLPPSRRRGLAIGGLLHDIGKLTVPDGILKKPAKLTDEEFVVIRRHPLWGVELLGELGGFNDAVQRLVLDHHERLDGGGYPHRKPTAEVGLDTRILSVCDVYSALVSARVYREVWSQEKAMALLRSETGSAFAARCAEALERVLRRDGVLPQPGEIAPAADAPLRAAA